MVDPVTTVDGHCYERSYVQQWVDGGGQTSPKTGSVLSALTLTPNHALRNSIEEWKESADAAAAATAAISAVTIAALPPAAAAAAGDPSTFQNKQQITLRSVHWQGQHVYVPAMDYNAKRRQVCV